MTTADDGGWFADLRTAWGRDLTYLQPGKSAADLPLAPRYFLFQSMALSIAGCKLAILNTVFRVGKLIY